MLKIHPLNGFCLNNCYTVFEVNEWCGGSDCVGRHRGKHAIWPVYTYGKGQTSGAGDSLYNESDH